MNKKRLAFTVGLTMGPVWSSADFDGIRELGHHGGCGSALAVTYQNFGMDADAYTGDDVPAPINQLPAQVSLDSAAGKNCEDLDDRVRGFLSFHSGRAFFVYGDGSVHILEESIEPRVYVGLSTIAGGEPVQ